MDDELRALVAALCKGIEAGSAPATRAAASTLGFWLQGRTPAADGLVLGLGVLNRAGKPLSQAGARGGNASLPAIEVLAAGESLDFRTLSCFALAGVGTVSPASIEPLARRLAADSNWAVREIIANALDAYMGIEQGDELFAMMERLAVDPDENIRRLPTNALMRYGRCHQDRVIGLMGKLRWDPSEYVRKNVVFCLAVMGSVKNPMIGMPDSSNPSRLMACLRAWLPDENLYSRWVIAETLGRKWSRGRETEASELLDLLDADSRPSIQRAVARARKALIANAGAASVSAP